ncbi:hypothetical protein NYR54_05940 [Chelativorans sp. SCAU2101]|jgi:hypothetical protein|uniref:Uncharacterized protein n=1 Tax=Chelativorans petroleitrophicus TaxID=2975484 RepID=A0A9X2X831_9HYPH|nr:hypothetical protein [Chelativorans petroleitrophicus]MCT8989834.1 hypothetical protein [Chelativorans petroleitrophicus]
MPPGSRKIRTTKTSEQKLPPAELEEKLVEGLKDTFPASDPVSVTRATRTGAPGELASVTPTADHGHERDGELEEALKDTFPASDPISLLSRTRAGSPARRGPQKR